MSIGVFQRVLDGQIFDHWGTTPIKALLERSTSTYTFNPDDTNVLSLSGFVEITVSGYNGALTGLELTGEASAYDATNNWYEFTSDDIDFGVLASGQTVKGLLLAWYIADPVALVPIYYDSDAADLPIALNGQNFSWTMPADGWFHAVNAP